MRKEILCQKNSLQIKKNSAFLTIDERKKIQALTEYSHFNKK